MAFLLDENEVPANCFPSEYFCNLQFAIRTSKASRPRRTPGTALPVRKAARVQAVTCLAQLAQPRKAWENPGRDSDHRSPAVTQADKWAH